MPKRIFSRHVNMFRFRGVAPSPTRDAPPDPRRSFGSGTPARGACPLDLARGDALRTLRLCLVGVKNGGIKEVGSKNECIRDNLVFTFGYEEEMEVK
ncbi:UNVERIFIED_CONTAM: hypothetical protein Sradi_6117200 [Sesamum radiatum]|uniref:Uncharacterized protein n=1 Tax=Sesamum radiatum TaxID=300843 RepID=A0AAW2KL05_SESRA